MIVHVEFFATLREKFGKKIDVKLEDKDYVRLRDILSRIEGLLDEITESNDLKPLYKVLINGLNIEFLDKLDTVVRDGDEIYIFPPAGGG